MTNVSNKTMELIGDGWRSFQTPKFVLI